MRFIHLSDLHIGKRLCDNSLEEDQRYILQQILDIISDEKPKGVLISGDVYDTTSPSNDAVSIFDWFLTGLAKLDVDVFIISGNHDSQDKLGFGSELFKKSGIFISGQFKGKIKTYAEEENGLKVDVCLLPFIKPSVVSRCYPDDEIKTYTDAVRSVFEHSELSGNKKILLAHQFVASSRGNPQLSDSETSSVGGLDEVRAEVFDGFDYVALGHLHIPQSVGRDTIRYSGSPLKYSASEALANKSVTVVEIEDEVTLREIPLTPLRDLRVITASIDDIIEASRGDDAKDDYIYVRFTDDHPLNAMERLREVFPNVLTAVPDGSQKTEDLGSFEIIEDKQIDELFFDFYESKTSKQLTDEQREYVSNVIDSMGASQ